MAKDIWNIWSMNEKRNVRVNTPYISFFETFASNRSFICDNHQTIQE